MIPLPAEQPEVSFERFSREWFQLLSRGDFAAAAASLDEPNSYGERWSGERIQQSIADYAGERPHAISDPALMPRDPYQSVVPFRDGSGFSYNCSFPLGGQWSDLTAQFEFLRRATGFSVILHDIHTQ